MAITRGRKSLVLPRSPVFQELEKFVRTPGLPKSFLSELYERLGREEFSYDGPVKNDILQSPMAKLEGTWDLLKYHRGDDGYTQFHLYSSIAGVEIKQVMAARILQNFGYEASNIAFVGAGDSHLPGVTQVTFLDSSKIEGPFSLLYDIKSRPGVLPIDINVSESRRVLAGRAVVSDIYDRGVSPDLKLKLHLEKASKSDLGTLPAFLALMGDTGVLAFSCKMFVTGYTLDRLLECFSGLQTARVAMFNTDKVHNREIYVVVDKTGGQPITDVARGDMNRFFLRCLRAATAASVVRSSMLNSLSANEGFQPEKFRCFYPPDIQKFVVPKEVRFTVARGSKVRDIQPLVFNNVDQSVDSFD